MTWPIWALAKASVKALVAVNEKKLYWDQSSMAVLLAAGTPSALTTVLGPGRATQDSPLETAVKPIGALMSAGVLTVTATPLSVVVVGRVFVRIMLRRLSARALPWAELLRPFQGLLECQ